MHAASLSDLPPVSWQRMSDAVQAIRERLLRASQALEAAGVRYAVIGGNAVAAWVSKVDTAAVRNTRDVDLLLDRADLDTASAALAAAGFHHRRLASPGQTGHLDIFVDGPAGSVRDALHIHFAGERVRSDSLEPNASVMDSENAGDFQLISLPALVTVKLSSWRDNDRVHLRDLLSTGLIDATWTARVPESQRHPLQQILDTPDD